MQEYSKEYRLLRQNIDFVLLQNVLTEIESKNDDLIVEIHHTIPDNIIEQYVEFGMEADQNTRGLLSQGEQSKLSVESIRTQYNLRSPDKFYFDVLVMTKDTKKIVGKLNSWGYRQGGPYFIFHMYVSKAYRNRGLGTLLLFKTIKIATDNIPNLTKFELQTHESNLPAQKTISKIGFKEN